MSDTMAAGLGLLNARAANPPPSGAGFTPRVLSSGIRVRPIPDISPPTIDSRATALPQVSSFIQGTLAISFTGGYQAVSNLPGRDGGEYFAPGDPGYFGPQRTPASELPEPQAWVRCMAQALVEVMSGTRPTAQVIRWTTPEVYSAIARRSAAAGRRTKVTRRAVVRQVRICQPADGVVEGCAVVLDNGRVRALAMRLAGVDRRWVITALQVG